MRAVATQEIEADVHDIAQGYDLKNNANPVHYGRAGLADHFHNCLLSVPLQSTQPGHSQKDLGKCGTLVGWVQIFSQ